jgi:hypothetical protein
MARMVLPTIMNHAQCGKAASVDDIFNFECRLLSRMYGPAVRCKWIRRAGGERSCINVSGL